MLQKKSLKLNVIINGIRVGLNMVFPLLIFSYVARVLGPDNLGKISFATSVTNYFVLLASLGIPSYGVLICAKERDDPERFKKTVCELIYVNLFCIAISYLLFIGTMIAVPKFWEARQLLLLESVSIILTAIGLDWLYNALEDFWYITVRSITFKIISLALVFLLVRRQEDYFIYAAILVLSTAGSNVVNLIHARKYIHLYPISELNVKRHLRPIFTLFAASIAGTISANTDTVMLGFMKDDFAVGLYNFSVKIKLLLSTIMTAGLTVFVPRFSYYIKARKEELYRTQIRQVFLLTLSVAAALCAFTVFFCDEIIFVLGDQAYYSAKPSVIVLTSCICVLACTWTLGVGILQPISREGEYAKGMYFGCAINIVLNAVLIPVMGVVGASIATFASESVIAISFYRSAKDFLQNCLKKTGFLRIMGASILSAFLSLQIVSLLNIHPFLRIASGGIIFVAVDSAFLLAIHSELRKIVFGQLGKVRNALKNKK